MTVNFLLFSVDFPLFCVKNRIFQNGNYFSELLLSEKIVQNKKGIVLVALKRFRNIYIESKWGYLLKKSEAIPLKSENLRSKTCYPPGSFLETQVFK